MPWVDDVSGLLQAWYSGNEAGNAISDILFGKVNPSGRLPLTFPVRLVDIPAYPNLPSANGKIHYREDLFVGYKHYQARKIEPLFRFGCGLHIVMFVFYYHFWRIFLVRSGLSYTKFSYSKFSITPVTSHDELFGVTIFLRISNVGSVSGSEVVQVFVEFPDISATIPPLQLKGFAKARDITPGGCQELAITLDKYAISFWDPARGAWNARAGKYRVFLGHQGEELWPGGDFELQESFYWSGL
jgi:beta-glucosidase